MKTKTHISTPATTHVIKELFPVVTSVGSVAMASPFSGTVKPADANAGYPLICFALQVHKPRNAGNLAWGIRGYGTRGAAIVCPVCGNQRLASALCRSLALPTLLKQRNAQQS